MFKLVTLACLVAAVLCDFQDVTFDNCDSDSSRFGQISMLQIDANPIHLQTSAFHINADIKIMQDLTDATNQANLATAVLSLDAEVKMGWLSDHICKSGSFLLNDHKCVLPLCDTVGADICDQLKSKKAGDVFSLRNQAFGPVTDLGWIGSILTGTIGLTDIKASIQSADYSTTYACGEIKGLNVDMGN